MTPDERNLLQGFLADLAQTRGPAKDPEADALIGQALTASPDAAYVLVQHAILSDQALHAARNQIADLQNQVRAAAAPMAPATSFLPSAPSPWTPVRPQAAGGYTGPGPFNGGGGLGSFIRAAAPTAAGVLGGEMLFHGLEGMFGGGRSGGYGGGVTENITNNYYSDDDSDDSGGQDGSDDGGSDDN